MLRSASSAVAVALVICGLAAAATRAAGAPPNLEPTAVSAVSGADWWLLAQSRSCLTATCDQTLLSTADSGRSFATASLPIADPVAIHAADAHDLFVSSTHGRLWFSSDAGQSWRLVNPRRPHGQSLFAGSVQTSDGDAYVVAWSGNVTLILRASLAALATARNPSSAWKPLAAPPGTTVGLMVRGTPWLALSQPSGYGFPRVYASNNGGGSFHPTGATLPVNACSFDPAGTTIWADCGTGMLVGIWRTTDGGRTFRPAGSDAYRKTTRSRPVIAGTSGAIFAPLSASAAILGLHPLYRTTNGGSSYERIAGTPAGVDEWMQFDVLRPGYALALGSFTVRGGTSANPRFGYRLYAVTDLGTRFHRIQIR